MNFKIPDNIRIRLLLWFHFLSISALVPFMSLYYQHLFSKFNEPHAIEFITLLLLIYPLLSIFSNPVAGFIADKFKIENRVLFFCSLIVILGTAFLILPGLNLIPFLSTPIVLAMCITGIILTGLFNGPIFPIINTETLEHIHRIGGPEGTYGKYRVHATFSWIIFTFVIGVLLFISGMLVLIPFFSIAGYILISIIARTGFQAKIKAVKIPLSLLLKDKRFFLFLIFCFIQSIGLFGSQFFISIFFEDAHLDFIFMGIAFAISAIPEIPILLNARKITAKLGNRNMIIIGTIFLILKLIGLGIAATLQIPWFMILIMLTHGLGFGFQVLGVVNYIDTMSHPDLKALYFNIYTVVGVNIPMALGLLLSGAMIKYFDSRIMMLTSAAIMVIAILYFFIFVRSPQKHFSQ